MAGALYVTGYAVIQSRLQKRFNIVDTCGVHNLHGMPGLLGGLAAVLVVPGIARAQLCGIAVTLALAIGGGYIGGYIIRSTGSRETVYEDGEEFSNAQG